jgi:hypothetical protein
MSAADKLFQLLPLWMDKYHSKAAESVPPGQLPVPKEWSSSIRKERLLRLGRRMHLLSRLICCLLFPPFSRFFLVGPNAVCLEVAVWNLRRCLR